MSSSYTTITGTDTANTLIVDTSGDDSVKALGGNDTVTGSGGNDIVDLAGGNDLVTQAGDYAGGTIYGGAGNDTIYSANTFSASAVYADADNDTIYVGGDVLLRQTSLVAQAKTPCSLLAHSPLPAFSVELVV